MGKFRSGGGGGGFNRGFGGSRPSGGRSFGGGGGSRFGRGRSDDKPEMHKAVCGECSKECEVPFRPTGDRPVFCSDCFQKRGAGRSEGGDRGGFSRGNFSQPRFDRPDFKARQDSGSGQKSADFTEQFNLLNTKLDQILKALTPVLQNKPQAEVVATEVKAKKKAVKAVVPAKKAVKKSSTKKTK